MPIARCKNREFHKRDVMSALNKEPRDLTGWSSNKATTIMPSHHPWGQLPCQSCVTLHHHFVLMSPIYSPLPPLNTVNQSIHSTVIILWNDIIKSIKTMPGWSSSNATPRSTFVLSTYDHQHNNQFGFLPSRAVIDQRYIWCAWGPQRLVIQQNQHCSCHHLTLVENSRAPVPRKCLCTPCPLRGCSPFLFPMHSHVKPLPIRK